jgi:hypothetical protein
LRWRAFGYLLKNTPPALLFKVIRQVQNGGAPISAQNARSVVETTGDAVRCTALPVFSPVAYNKLHGRSNETIRRIALKYAEATDFLFLGRQLSFPAALEGALSLKEISYIHVEGYPAAEMKYGRIAPVDKLTLTVFVATVDHIYEKTQSNIEEVKARKGPIIAIPMEGNDALAKKVDDIISVSRSLDSSLTTSLLPRPRRGQT